MNRYETMWIDAQKHLYSYLQIFPFTQEKREDESYNIDAIDKNAVKYKTIVMADCDRSKLKVIRATKKNSCIDILDLENLANQIAGNVVAFEMDDRKISFVCGSSSCYPLYFYVDASGIRLSNKLAPLASALRDKLDEVGVAQYLNAGYVIGKRTFFRNISKLCPGQSAVFDMQTLSLTLREFSDVWNEEHSLSINETVYRLSLILHGLAHSLFVDASDNDVSLMFSGGWDSRLILAAMLATPGAEKLHLSCYENSEIVSDEMELVQKIATRFGLPLHALKALLDPAEIEYMREIFVCAEVCCFPEWYMAGRVAASRGANTLVSGILGEVIGGHYGPMDISGVGGRLQQAFLPSCDGRFQKLSCANALSMIKKRVAVLPWFFTAKSEDIIESIEADLDGELQRYQSRGITTGARFAEAYYTENRGMQHFSEQAAAARAHLNVSFPFADYALLKLSASTPHHWRYGNRLTRRLVKKIYPALLDYRTAAVLVPTKYPVALQEFSRMVRKSRDEVQTRVHIRSKGAISSLPRSYRTCEYLRDSKKFDVLLDYLTIPNIDKEGLRKLLRKIDAYEVSTPVWHMFWQMTKLLRVEFYGRYASSSNDA